MVLSGVIEEKSSRTVEVLLARMPARNLLAGKIAGIGILGLAQIAATATVALVVGALVDSFDVPAVRGGVLAWAVVWFLLGYALYATVFGTLGSLASRTEDASSVAGPITIVLVLAFMVSFATVGSVDTTWARLVSWFPLTAPLAMPNRIAMGAATWWDPVIASVLTLAAIAGLVVLGGRVYTRAILHTGATLSLGEVWRGASPTLTRAAPTPETDPTKHESSVGIEARRHGTPTQIAAIVLGFVLGSAAFALAHDFVIGVGIGAAVYAIAVRVAKLWTRRSGALTETSHDRDRETVGR
jgi:ABC-2 type transport system permease protein